MERSIREEAAHAALIERKEKTAEERGLPPLVSMDKYRTGDFAIVEHYRTRDFADGGTGTSFYAINAQRPTCGIRLFPALDTFRGHSSGITGKFRRWQEVWPKDAIVPQGFRCPPSTRWIVVWIGMIVVEHGIHRVEPTIFIAPFIPVNKTTHKVAPFILECGPQDLTAALYVSPRRERNTHVNGFLSRLFGIFLEEWKKIALIRWFPCAPIAEEPAPPETPAAAVPEIAAPLPPITTPSPPPPPPSAAAGRRPPTFAHSQAAASSYGLRARSPLTTEQTSLLEDAQDWKLRAEKAESSLQQLRLKNARDKKRDARKQTPKPPKTERLPARPGRKWLEDHLNELYSTSRKAIKWYVCIISSNPV